MKNSLFAFAFLGSTLVPAWASPFSDWAVVSPTLVGFSAEKLRDARQFALSSNSPAGMVLYQGKILLSWGNTSKKFQIYSGRKSIMSALVGIAVERKQVTLEKTLAELKIDDVAPTLSPTEKQASVLDLLKSRSGVYHSSARETVAMKMSRPQRGSHLPGTHFYYNNWDFNTLAAIYEKSVRQSVAKAFDREIAKPLGLQDFALTDVHRVYERRLSKFPAITFSLSARDYAKFGQMYLQKGDWEGEQIIPEKWVQESTTGFSIVRSRGYGFSWWASGTSADSLFYGAPLGTNAFSAEGMNGHYLVIAPDHDLVVVSFSEEESIEFGQPSFGAPKLSTFLSMVLAAKL